MSTFPTGASLPAWSEPSAFSASHEEGLVVQGWARASDVRLQEDPGRRRSCGAVGGRRCSCSHCGRTWAPGSQKASLPQLCDSGATAASASENQDVDGGQRTFLSLQVASQGPNRR